MSDRYSNRFYSRALKRHGSGPRAVGWQDEAAQSDRFAALDSALPLAGSRVLDVGCGIGAFCRHMRATGRNWQYTGIDPVPEMIAKAQAAYPDCAFHAASLEEASDGGLFPPQSFDYVVASGTFSRNGTCDAGYVAGFARRMFGLCRRAIAFNSLSSAFDGNQFKGFSVDPAVLFPLLLDITDDIGMEHSPTTGDVLFVLRRRGDSA